MRRILRALAVRKRESANKAERQAWQSSDLLFISAYGEDSDRALTFAHFVESPDLNLAELRVLGWDDDDTPLKLDYVVRTLGEKLRWQEDFATHPKKWRAQWSEAFRIRHGHVIRTSAELALALAVLARRIRARVSKILEMEAGTGEIRTLQRAFRIGLIHDLDDAAFADMFAQTITYGLFSLACRRTHPGAGTAFVKDDLSHYFTSPFLREMLGIFLGIKSRKGKIDFDELGISDVTDLLTSPDTHMEAVLIEFGNKTRGEDPVVHFYEDFLSAYNKQLKVQRGVFYTPQPVVSYIVRSVHELLQTEFGLADGLAATTTWGEMVKKHPGMKLPPLTDEPGEKRTVKPGEPFVQILDPATGTATFLVEVIDVIHRHLEAKWKKGGAVAMPSIRNPKSPIRNFADYWNAYVPEHLLPRLHAFELMMAPYAIAHMKIGLKLVETGYQFAADERARIYLTNALEPKVSQLPQLGFEALASEAEEVNEIKWYRRFTVVIGNPPYSNFGQLNKNKFILGLLDDYKRGLDERKLNLDDDFIKFVRFSQQLLDATGIGVLGMITNSTFLDGVNHRKMREILIRSFPVSFFLNLHGNTKRKENPPNGAANDNVFDIMQGVAVSLMVKASNRTKPEIRYYDAWGTREEKYQLLCRSTGCMGGTVTLNPTSDRFFLVAKDFLGADEYEAWPSLKSMFPLHSLGIETSRDDFAVAFDKNTIVDRINKLRSPVSDGAIRDEFGLDDKRDWNLPDARRRLKKIGDILPLIQRVQYRPCDERFICYSDAIVTWPRHEVLDNLIRKNIALICVRNSREDSISNFYCTKHIADKAVISSRDNAAVFPLHRQESSSSESLFARSGTKLSPNLSPDFVSILAKFLGQPLRGNLLPAGLTPEDIFHYAYAVFHSPGYRSRYAEFLKIDFPRLPLTGNLELFRALARLGGELTALHLLESPKLDRYITDWIGGRNPEVEKISWAKNTVWVDKAQTAGFRGVRESVWNFHIGGYQVCEKWLKDRKGRTLTKDDIAHYHKIVVALSETIRLMAEIDTVIAKHGGWPGAFAGATPSTGSAAPVEKRPAVSDLGIRTEDELPLA
jgi:hypothetical protein